jgi:hypothetical protein
VVPPWLACPIPGGPHLCAPNPCRELRSSAGLAPSESPLRAAGAARRGQCFQNCHRWRLRGSLRTSLAVDGRRCSNAPIVSLSRSFSAAIRLTRSLSCRNVSCAWLRLSASACCCCSNRASQSSSAAGGSTGASRMRRTGDGLGASAPGGLGPARRSRRQARSHWVAARARRIGVARVPCSRVVPARGSEGCPPPSRGRYGLPRAAGAAWCIRGDRTYTPRR